MKKPAEKKEVKQPEEKYTQQINALVDMGFEKSQAEAAIKASKGQIDLAVEFLYNGIPEGINEMMDLDQGMREGENNGEEGDDNNDEDPVKIVASIAKIVCRNNPSALTQLLRTIEDSDPDLMNLIKEREEEFKNFLEEPVNDQDFLALQKYQQQMGLGLGMGGGEGESHGHGERQGQIRINLTPEEQEAIKRLKELGNFSEADVVQAYIACDKNEELTANYLFEQKMKEDEEMFGDKNNNNNNNGNA